MIALCISSQISKDKSNKHNFQLDDHTITYIDRYKQNNNLTNNAGKMQGFSFAKLINYKTELLIDEW